jgi:hypothetical protein
MTDDPAYRTCVQKFLYIDNAEYSLVLRRFVLRRFKFTPPVQSDRALPTHCPVGPSTADSLSSRTEHCRLVVHRCRNSSLLSLISVFLALFLCACVSCFVTLVQFFKVDCDFSTHDVRQKHRKEQETQLQLINIIIIIIKQLTLHSVLLSSEPRPGPSSAK